MLNVFPEDVKTDPFPHVISEQILDPGFYAELRRDYPTAAIFEDQKTDTGLSGSRTGQGFDIYRGDATYDRLIKGHEDMTARAEDLTDRRRLT